MSKPKNKIKLVWSPDFAYAIGLIATDGCLSKDGRHIDLTSKDKEQLKTFLKCLNIKNKIAYKSSGSSKKLCYRIQFGDVCFYKFLLNIGITPQKSKTIEALDIPDRYFFDFLRGHLDGDGTFYSYWDKRWKSSFMFYTVFISASKNHINWIQKELFFRLKIKGHISKAINNSVYQLKYAKSESMQLLKNIYNKNVQYFLKRKYLKIKKCLGIIGKQDLI